MRYNDFVAQVAALNPERSHHDAAHGAAHAVLEAIGPHLARDEVAGLARHLPDDLAPALDTSGRDEGAGGDPDLAARVVQRVGVDEREAAGYVRAVGAALRDTLGEEDFERTMQALPAVLRSQIG